MIRIRPGKVTCAGVVVIFMVLPSSIWQGPDATLALPSAPKLETPKNVPDSDLRVKFGKAQ